MICAHRSRKPVLTFRKTDQGNRLLNRRKLEDFHLGTVSRGKPRVRYFACDSLLFERRNGVSKCIESLSHLYAAILDGICAHKALQKVICKSRMGSQGRVAFHNWPSSQVLQGFMVRYCWGGMRLVE